MDTAWDGASRQTGRTRDQKGLLLVAGQRLLGQAFRDFSRSPTLSLRWRGDGDVYEDIGVILASIIGCICTYFLLLFCGMWGCSVIWSRMVLDHPVSRLSGNEYQVQ